MFYLYKATGAACSSTPYHVHARTSRGCGYCLFLSAPCMGGLFETENGLLFYEVFFVTLYYSRMHCVQFYLTEDLNVIQNT